MSGIRIAVKQRLFLGKSYDLKIYLNEQFIGIVPLNETMEFELQPGEYNLQTKYRFFGSRNYPFSLLVKEKRSFTISENILWNLFLFIFISFITGLALFIQNKGVLLGITIVGLLYFLLFRRNSFLIINEE